MSNKLAHRPKPYVTDPVHMEGFDLSMMVHPKTDGTHARDVVNSLKRMLESATRHKFSIEKVIEEMEEIIDEEGLEIDIRSLDQSREGERSSYE